MFIRKLLPVMFYSFINCIGFEVLIEDLKDNTGPGPESSGFFHLYKNYGNEK